MTNATAQATTRRHYDAMAERYAQWVPGVFVEQKFDLAMLRAFAELVTGHEQRNILDIGCGPGHVTAWLARLGATVSGIDLSPAMIRLAREAHPDLTFDVGSLLDLAVADASVGGVLAHFSIIHTPPADVPVAIGELARVLAIGGYVLLAFQTGDAHQQGWEPFDHQVSPAYCWSIDAIAALLPAAGLEEIARLRVEPEPTDRYHGGYLIARKRVRISATPAPPDRVRSPSNGGTSGPRGPR